MTEELINALVSRVQQNEDRDMLRKEVLAAGYDLSEFNDAYAEAQRRVGLRPNIPPQVQSAAPQYPQTPEGQTEHNQTAQGAMAPSPQLVGAEESPVQPAPPPSPPVSSQSVASEATVSTPHTSKKVSIFIGVGGFVVLLILAIVLAFTVKSGPLAFLSNMFAGGEPYAEGSLLDNVMQGISEIESSGYKVTYAVQAVEKDADTHLLPEELMLEDAMDVSSLFAMLPQDFNFSGEVAGNFDLSEPEKPKGHTQIKYAYETDDFSMNADVEVVAAYDDGIFVRINRMPSMLFFDFSVLKGEWLHVFTHSPAVRDEQEIDRQAAGIDSEALEQFKYIFAQAQKHQLLISEGIPEKADINGEVSYKYSVVLNEATVKDFFVETMADLRRQYGDDHVLAEFNREFNLDRFSSSAYIKFFNTHNKLVLWARPDGIPVRFGVESRIAIDDDVKDPLILAREQGVDASKKSRVSSVRAPAEIYFDTNDRSYTDFCTSDAFAYFDPDWEYVCEDTDTMYAVDIVLNDDTKYCVDSTGFSETGYEVSGNACVAQPPVIAKEAVEREAERQVNVSIYLDLTNVNKPVAIEIPADALSPAEITEIDPMIGGTLIELNQAYNSANENDPRMPLVPRVRGFQFMKDQMTQEVIEVPYQATEQDMTEKENSIPVLEN